MLKILAIIASIFALASLIGISASQNVPPNAPKKGIVEGNSAGKGQPEAAAQREDQNSAKVPSVVVQVESPNVESNRSNSHEDEAAKELARYTFGLMVFTLGLVAVGIIHANHLHKLGRAATDNAKAALLNAQAVINAERPWVLISVKSPPGPMGGFTVHARNRGRTPAMITEARMGCAAVKSVSELPLKADFTIENPIRDRIIIPGGAAHIIWFDTRLFKAVLKENLPQFSWDGQIFVFGKVLYRDLANPDKSVTHETRWIGLYQPPVGDEGGNSIFRVEGIGISDEYDRYT